MRCKDLNELQVRLPEWESWGRELEAETGQALDEGLKILTLDQLVPVDIQVALDDRPELKTYGLQFVKRRLDLVKHRDLARLANHSARVAMDVGNLDAVDEEADQSDPTETGAAYSLVRKGQGRRKGEGRVPTFGCRPESPKGRRQKGGAVNLL